MSDTASHVSATTTVASVASLPETVMTMASTVSRRPLRPLNLEQPIILRPAAQRLQRNNDLRQAEEVNCCLFQCLLSMLD